MSSFSYYIHPHYIFNFFLSVVYPLLRNFGLKSQHLKSEDSWGFQREYSIITGIATIIILRFLKYFSNYKKFTNEVLFYTKCGNGICLYFIDIRLFCWYLFVCFVVWILFRPPMYNGPNKMIYVSSQEMFYENIISKKNKSSKVDSYAFVVFYSNYSENCIFVRNINVLKLKFLKS